MGWNSWDCWGTIVTEAQTKANADYMAQHLATYGWQYIVVDIQWYEPNGTGYQYPGIPQSNIDAYGRLWPVANKHPSSINGLGFKLLADHVHSKGLKFGIHLMRGIPRRAWQQDSPVLGTAYSARDIANTNSICSWNPDMYGVDMSRPGAQEYYNSVFALIASWDVDFVKVDDLSRPYHQAEIEAIRLAIENSGRPMVLSTSPGETPLASGAHVFQHANMWRISDDFWDTWQALYDQFQRLHDWTPYRGPGYWPDADMLPLGNIRAMESSGNWTRFTTNEQRTLMTMWSIARSPLMMGGHMPDNDAFTLSLLTNREVIAVNQASLNNRQLSRAGDRIVWTADVPGSAARYVAFINANDLGFDESSAVFDSGVISRSTPGRSTNIVAGIAGASKLYLVVTDGGDYFGWDHADWGFARIGKPDGSSNRLSDLNWVSATSGWNPPPKKNTSIDGNPMSINGAPISHGVGTHASSVIEYNLPAGFTEFRALAGLDDEILSTVPSAPTNATVRFMIFTNEPTGRTVEVTFASLGIDEPVLVRDLWLQQDVGIFTNGFKRKLTEHASALFKFTPVSAITPVGAPAGLRATVETNRVSLRWNPVPGAEPYSVRRAALWGGPFKKVAGAVTGTNFIESGLSNGTWFYSVSARQGGVVGPASAEAAAYVEFPWQTHDIGAVQQPGNTILSDGTFQLSATGTDIWNSSDAFRYLFTPLSGDATVIARVRHQSGNDPWEKAGIMIRESTNSSSKHVFLLMSPSALALQYRAQTGGASAAAVNLNGFSGPIWLKLERRGNDFTAQYSDDGESWIHAGFVNVPMNSIANAGLAVTAHSSSKPGTAFFDQVSVRNSAAPAAPLQLDVTALSESQAGLAWIDGSTDETSFAVEHNIGGAWEIVADDLVANTTNFMDSGLTPLAQVSFRVRAINAGVFSAYSPAVGLIMPQGVGDGIPGWWRLQYFGDGLSGSGSAAFAADPDSDGASNAAEFLAGTNPTNTGSVFGIRGFSVGQNSVEVEFSAIAGRSYSIEQTYNLLSPWTVLSSNIAGTNGNVRVSLDRLLELPSSFYRVAVGWPESIP